MVTPPVQLTTRPGPSSAGPSSVGQPSAGQSSAASSEIAVSETVMSETVAPETGQSTGNVSVTREEPAREGARLASKAGPARSGITLTSITSSYRDSHGQATTLIRK